MAVPLIPRANNFENLQTLGKLYQKLHPEIIKRDIHIFSKKTSSAEKLKENLDVAGGKVLISGACIHIYIYITRSLFACHAKRKRWTDGSATNAERLLYIFIRGVE